MYKYFENDELKCRCGKCGLGQEAMDAFFMAKITELRKICRFPLVISSAIRCPEYNNKVSNSGLDGAHTTGHAIDIVVSMKDSVTLLNEAMKMEIMESGFYVNAFSGFGVNQKGSGRFIHLDDLPNSERFSRPALWTY
jgi:hypothetical protein